MRRIRRAASHRSVEELVLLPAGQQRFVHQDDEADDQETDDDLLSRLAATDVLAAQRVAHADVALHGERHDDPGRDEPADVSQVGEDLARALVLQEGTLGRARVVRESPPEPVDQDVEHQGADVGDGQGGQIGAGRQFPHVVRQKHDQAQKVSAETDSQNERGHIAVEGQGHGYHMVRGVTLKTPTSITGAAQRVVL